MIICLRLITTISSLLLEKNRCVSFLILTYYWMCCMNIEKLLPCFCIIYAWLTDICDYSSFFRCGQVTSLGTFFVLLHFIFFML